MSIKTTNTQSLIPKLDEEKLAKNLKYLKDGLETIQEQANTGFLTAFPNKYANQEGFLLSKEYLKTVLDEYDIAMANYDLPEFFDFTIKYSSIAQFQKWIFNVTNHNYLMVSERQKEMSMDFFLMVMNGRYVMLPISTNIAHEKFLLYLFQREKIAETSFTFSTYFDDSKRLIVYKDYEKRKVSSIKIPQTLIPGKLYNIKITLIKSSKVFKSKIQVNNGKVLNHNIRFGAGEEEEAVVEQKDGAKKVKSSKAFKSLEEFREDVLKVISVLKSEKRETNKFANVSLGRVNKIPVLINLPSKYKDMPIILNFNKKKELEVCEMNGELIKIFSISTNPRSNWLEKK